MREEHDAVTSNGMNNDCTNKIHSSDSDNNRNGDVNFNLNQISQVWGTWEELLLTCAVKRHGFKDWDSVAKEVRSRTSLNVSGPICKLKYQDLKRRFRVYVADDGNREAVAEEDRDGEIPWLDQLRSLRVAELRREVQRCDDTILSLQLKVKKLEEEDGSDGDNKPDLEDDSKAVRSLNDETEQMRLNRETTESDHRSMNESNSMASVDKIADHERLSRNKIVQANENPDPARKAKVTEEEEGTVSRRSGMSHSGELGESGTSTGHRKWKGHKYMSGEDSNIYGGSGGNMNKSQPLIDIVKLIRSHPGGYMFETRLRSQETKDYKRLIRQHLDIKTIEKKLEKGSYVSSSLSFYRDLKLLFTNAIVFFPKSSSESMAAQELRTLVSNEMKKKTGKSTHCVIKEEAESSGPPLVACKKKSSASKKTVPSSSSLKQKDEKKSQEVSEEKKTVTTTTATAARSSRRTSKGMDVVVARDTKIVTARNSKNKQTDSSDDDDEEETHKKEKKTVVIASEKKSVAEFLKRIKKNSPQKGKKTTTSKDQKKSDGNVKKDNSRAKPRELRSNGSGKKKVEVENNSNKSPSNRKQSKKETEEVTAAAATGKRGRESGKDNQQPKKRSRR